jgi:hypothetical protein
LFRDITEDIIPSRESRRMDLNMLALEVLGAIFEGVINEVIAPIEILVVTEDYIFVGSRQILLNP